MARGARLRARGGIQMKRDKLTKMRGHPAREALYQSKMRNPLWIVMTFGLLAVAADGCHQASSDLAGSVCQKADSCATLSGVTAAQCKDLVNTSLQSMSG